MITHVLSFDVEDWYQGFVSRGIEGWQQHGSNEQRNVERILELLQHKGVRATFFTLGKFAQDHPAVVRSIAQAGHEIASHGFAHKPIPSHTVTTFREDIRRSTGMLQDIIGKKVRGHRAAGWSLRRDCLWALDVLAEENIEYDSSVFPTSLHKFGLPESPRHAHRIELSSGNSIVEFPAQVLRLGPIRLPVAGGFYMRALPLAFSRWGLRQAEKSGNSGMVYLHPYDLDPKVPEIKVPPAFRIIRYYRLGTTETYLRRLLTEFQFSPVCDLLDDPAASFPLHTFS